MSRYVIGLSIQSSHISADYEMLFQLPADIDDENITPTGYLCSPRTSVTEPPTMMTGCIHVIKLRRLWGTFSDNLYPSTCRHCGDNCSRHVPVEQLREELEEWHASTPGELDQSAASPLSVFASSEWFQLAYDHSILLLYRHYIANPLSQHDSTSCTSVNENVEKAFEECAIHAREMCLLYRRLY
jgi:hypothetical protein